MHVYIDILQIVFIILGIMLITLEIIMPGFGIPGVSGMIFLVIGIFSYRLDMTTSLIYLVFAIMISFVVGIVLGKWLKDTGRMDSVILKEKKIEVSKNTNDKYIGKQGKTTTILRPSGFMDIDGERIDVMTKGEYIEEDSLVQVIEVDGNSIFVRRI